MNLPARLDPPLLGVRSMGSPFREIAESQSETAHPVGPDKTASQPALQVIFRGNNAPMFHGQSFLAQGLYLYKYFCLRFENRRRLPAVPFSPGISCSVC